MTKTKKSWKENLNKMYEAIQLTKKTARTTIDNKFRDKELKQILKILGWKDPNNQIVKVDINADIYFKPSPKI